MLAAIRQCFNVELPLRTFFSAINLVKFAVMIQTFGGFRETENHVIESLPRAEFAL